SVRQGDHSRNRIPLRKSRLIPLAMKITWLAPFLLTVQLCFIYGIVLGQSVETAWQSGCAGNDSEVVFYILPGPNCSSFPNVTSPGGWVVNPSSGVTIMPIETGPGTYNQVRM